jgi:transposase
MRALILSLDPAQEAELAHLRDHHPKPYVRERASALLQVAAGRSARQVARHGLLRPRGPKTVHAWLRRYQTQGAAGLGVQPGRGRKPAFSPCACGRG